MSRSGDCSHAVWIEGRKAPELDRRTTWAKGYRLSQSTRKRCENILGWMKTAGTLRQNRWRDVEQNLFMAKGFTAICNFPLMPRLMEESPLDTHLTTRVFGITPHIRIGLYVFNTLLAGIMTALLVARRRQRKAAGLFNTHLAFGRNIEREDFLTQSHFLAWIQS